MKSLFAIALFGIFALAGCKQGKGERCQVMSDCADGLVCNIATNTCQETTGGGIDATVPPQIDAGADAAGSDAMPADAMPADATPD